MHHEQRDRVHDYLNTKGIDRALFTGSYSATWLTDFAPPVQVGSGPLAGIPSLVKYEGEQFPLIVLDSQAESRARSYLSSEARYLSAAYRAIAAPIG